MHVISRRAMRDAIARYPDAAGWLNNWWEDAGKARWRSLQDVRKNYPTADQVNRCLIFNVKGNRYRLICRVTYANQWQRGTILFKHCLTHADYDKQAWNKDCE